jgi:ribonuclease P/MRP protein subunit POP1
MSNAEASNRRKRPFTGSNGNNNNNQNRNKRPKIWDTRNLSSQTSDKAFSNGDLNVDSFVKAREFEIKALEDGIKKSKHGLTTRAFQEVPKDLRRRTASHNVRKIPKRLRKRATREVRGYSQSYREALLNTIRWSKITRPLSQHEEGSLPDTKGYAQRRLSDYRS